MNERVNRQWLLAARPEGMVEPSHFELRESAVPEIGGRRVPGPQPLPVARPGDADLDDRPAQLCAARRAGRGDARDVHGAGGREPQRRLRGGRLLVGIFGWQDYAVAQGDWSVSKVPQGTPLTWPLSVLGITTLTAYFGLKEIAKPKEGETVAVSGAAGATGSVAAQLGPLVGMPDHRHRRRPREVRLADRRARPRRRDRLQGRGRESPLARAVPGRDRRVLGQRRGDDPRSGAREPRDARPRRAVRRDRQLQR